MTNLKKLVCSHCFHLPNMMQRLHDFKHKLNNKLHIVHLMMIITR